MEALVILFFLLVILAIGFGVIASVSYMTVRGSMGAASMVGSAIRATRRYFIGESLSNRAPPTIIEPRWVTILETEQFISVGSHEAKVSRVRLRTHVGVLEPTLRRLGYLREDDHQRAAMPRMLHQDRPASSLPAQGPRGRAIFRELMSTELLVTADEFIGVVVRFGSATHPAHLRLLDDALSVEGKSDDQIRDWILDEWFNGTELQAARAAEWLFDHFRGDEVVASHFLRIIDRLPEDRARTLLLERDAADVDAMRAFVELEHIGAGARIEVARHMLEFADDEMRLWLMDVFIVGSSADGVQLALELAEQFGLETVATLWRGWHKGTPGNRVLVLTTALSLAGKHARDDDFRVRRKAESLREEFSAVAWECVENRELSQAHRIELVTGLFRHCDRALRFELARKLLDMESRLVWAGIEVLCGGGIDELTLLVGLTQTFKARERDIFVGKRRAMAKRLHEVAPSQSGEIAMQLERVLDLIDLRYDELLARDFLNLAQKFGPELPRRILRDVADARGPDTPGWMILWFAKVGEYEDVARLHTIVEAGGDNAEDAQQAMRVIQSQLGGDIGAMAVVDEYEGGVSVVEEGRV